MPTLELRLLGAPTVAWNGAQLSILRRQTRLLLYYLAVPGRPVARDHLSVLFWPDVPAATAGRNLSHLLTHLRQALPDRNALVASEDQVYLDPQMTWSDVAEFLELRGSRGGRKDIDSLARAVQLYRGPFLDGVFAPRSPDCEAWITVERYTLERRYRDTLHTLIEECTRTGDYDEAIRYANHYLATDRLDESIHRRLIMLYAARGDRAAALHQYRQCEALLERELGVRPLPETLATYTSILTPRERDPGSHEAAFHWTTLSGPHLPMIGREKPWQMLTDLRAMASTGRGRLALITGEAGSGKSRLLEQFVTQFHTMALVAAGQPGTLTLPFHVLIQAIRPHLRIDRRTGRILNPRLRDMSPSWLAEATLLFPELAGDPRIAAVPRVNRRRADRELPQLYECLCRLVCALSVDERPALLCLDNLQWVDAETLGWLAYFAPQLMDMPMLALAACRSDECDRLADLRREYSRMGLLTEIKLEGLPEHEVRELLRHIGHGERPDDRLVARIHAAAGGNPHAAIQICAALQECGLPFREWATVEELPAPSSLCSAVGRRSDALSPVTRQVLEACVVLAPSFDFDLVRLTSGRREMETLESLEELVHRDFLECRGDEYGFRQDMTQHVLQQSMSPMRRQLLHRRAGRALEHLGRRELDALARHFEAAGDLAKAAHYCGLAKQRADNTFPRDTVEYARRESSLPPQ